MFGNSGKFIYSRITNHDSRVTIQKYFYLLPKDNLIIMKKLLLTLIIFLISGTYVLAANKFDFDYFMNKADVYYSKVHSKEESKTPQGKENLRLGMINAQRAKNCDEERFYRTPKASSNLALAMLAVGDPDECLMFCNYAITKVTSESEKEALAVIIKSINDYNEKNNPTPEPEPEPEPESEVNNDEGIDLEDYGYDLR